MPRLPRNNPQNAQPRAASALVPYDRRNLLAAPNSIAKDHYGVRRCDKCDRHMIESGDLIYCPSLCEGARPCSLSENLGLADTITTRTTYTKSLSENLGLADTATTSASRTVSLTENLGLADTTARLASKNISLSENLVS